jgi:hypothetical protein
MEKLGFQIGSIRNTGKTNYIVFIKGFSAKLPGFTHKGKFKSFSMNVSVILKPGNRDKAGMIGDMGNKDKAGLIGDFGTKVKGTVVLKRSSLLKQNFILDDKAFPKDLSVKIQ